MFAFPTETFGIGEVSWPTDVAVPARYPRVARIRHATKRKKRADLIAFAGVLSLFYNL